MQSQLEAALLGYGNFNISGPKVSLNNNLTLPGEEDRDYPEEEIEEFVDEVLYVYSCCFI